ncbi:sugar transporter, putative [Plasmodium gaboni]|uniref:Sugar transporter, putative n=1 Tax=Plasmodium gaboni TaxID=647221 RepID=A0ABY1UJJ0_9APIC|nr:sugar transporter, putative [Plasmodium gaboni]
MIEGQNSFNKLIINCSIKNDENEDYSKNPLLNKKRGNYSAYLDIPIVKHEKIKKLKLCTIISFSCPMIGVGGMNLISTIYGSYFYTNIVGLRNIHLTLMFLYAFIEIFFGCISHKSKSMCFKIYGKGMSFLLLSSIFQAISFFLFLNPPLMFNSIWKLKLWSYIWSVLFGISWGCSEVAYESLASQLTYDYDERKKLQLFTWHISIIGSMSCSLLNGLLGSFSEGYTYKEKKKYIFIITFIYSILYLCGIFITMVVLINKDYNYKDDFVELCHVNNYKMIKNIFNNRPFILLLISYSFTLLCSAVCCMLLPYFCRYIIQSNFLINWSPLFFTTCMIIGIPLWIYINKILSVDEKKYKYILSSGLLCISLTTCSFVVDKNDEVLFLFFFIIGGLTTGSFFSISESMKGDVINYIEFLYGIRNYTTYAGIFMCISNIIAGIGLKFSLYYINIFNDIKSINGYNKKQFIRAIRSSLCAFICLTFFIILITMFFYPIDRFNHKKILHGIKMRKMGHSVEDPLNPGKILLPFCKLNNNTLISN